MKQILIIANGRQVDTIVSTTGVTPVATTLVLFFFSSFQAGNFISAMFKDLES